MQSTNILLDSTSNSNGDAYGQMADMSSGCSGSFLKGTSRHSSFRDASNTFIPILSNSFHESGINENVGKNDNDDSAVYNFPWDVKNKNNHLLMHTSQVIEAQNSAKPIHALTPPPPPQCPPPSTSNLTSNHSNKVASDEDDETQYCAPWDLKLQEEMFKKMSQIKKNNGPERNNENSSNNNEDTNKSNGNESLENMSLNNTSATKTNNNTDSNNSIKLSTDVNTKIQIQQSNIDANEYSPPWELKQSALMQSIQSQSSLKSTPQQQQQVISNMPAPLSTSSAVSTLTSNNQNQSALVSLFNQFSRTRLSTRSNTSSSSSTRSSTSSLSASSPPSIPPPPLPPSIPPPPPPTSSGISRCNSHSNHTHQLQQSPRLPHRHLSQHNSSSNLPGNNNSLLMPRIPGTNLAFVPGINNSTVNNSCTSCSSKKANISHSHHQNFGASVTNTLQTNSTYLNESNFCSWGSTGSSNTNSFENTNCDDPKNFCRQNRGGSNHHFAYPSMTNHFQTVPNGGQQIQTNDPNNKNIQLAMPVTALVFANNSLPTNLLPINIQHHTLHQQNSSTQPLISPASLSHLQLLEKQVWFHGKVTRKYAESILENKPIGSFLIRQSESGNANDFSLSLVGSGCVHMRISMKNGDYILGQCSQPFNSIVKMVEHYGKVEVPIKGALHVKLTHPLPRTC